MRAPETTKAGDGVMVGAFPEAGLRTHPVKGQAMGQNMPPNGGDGNGPLTPSVVRGELRIKDVELGARLGFAKPVKIRELIKRHLPSLEAMGTVPTMGTVNRGQEATEFYLNRKQAIFITAKSETAEATEITIEIIERFDAYEKAAAPADPMSVLNNPAAMRGLLLNYTEKVLTLEAKVQEQAPSVAALDRIANANGNVNMTLAAKTLQVPPHSFMAWCDTHGWTYKRGTQRMAYQDKINAGYLDMKTDTVQRPDGSDKAVYQVFVTPKGLTKLAKLLGASHNAPASVSQAPSASPAPTRAPALG